MLFAHSELTFRIVDWSVRFFHCRIFLPPGTVDNHSDGCHNEKTKEECSVGSHCCCCVCLNVVNGKRRLLPTFGKNEESNDCACLQVHFLLDKTQIDDNKQWFA